MTNQKTSLHLTRADSMEAKPVINLVMIYLIYVPFNQDEDIEDNFEMEDDTKEEPLEDMVQEIIPM